MREILFRGKRTDNGEWIVGMLGQYHEGIKATIVLNHLGTVDSVDFICVDPDTVGQYTGLLDKNGKRIFEGDVLRWVGPDGEVGKVYVMFVGGIFALQSVECPLAAPDLFADFEIGEQTLEVIGNIHDNPELLEGGGEDG